MNLNTLMLIYTLVSVPILIFLLAYAITYKKRFLHLLFDPDQQVRVAYFFQTLSPTLNKIYPLLDTLVHKRGRQPTDYHFQFRWLLWWKFFGPPVLQRAIRTFNHSSVLRELLGAPPKDYTRFIFHGFRKKLARPVLINIQTILLTELQNRRTLNWKTVVFDSFPIFSYLNSAKCLQRPKLVYQDLKKFLDAIDLTPVVAHLQTSPKKLPNVTTKLLALLTYLVWDLNSWPQCYQVLYKKASTKVNLQLPKVYAHYNSLADSRRLLQEAPYPGKLAELLRVAAVSALKKTGLKPSAWDVTDLWELVTTFHQPHRFKDKGIRLAYCAAKKIHFFGRGGLLAVLSELELPVLVQVTSGYKQNRHSVVNFLQHFYQRFGVLAGDHQVVADSEFGVTEVYELLEELEIEQVWIPKYKTSTPPAGSEQVYKQHRTLIERVIGRLETNWHLEHPRHVGRAYAEFHVQLAVLCDQIQVLFNELTGNSEHPHAIRTIRG